jgi:hypothetical protein
MPSRRHLQGHLLLTAASSCFGKTKTGASWRIQRIAKTSGILSNSSGFGQTGATGI